jgi:hypothetical protein
MRIFSKARIAFLLIAIVCVPPIHASLTAVNSTPQYSKHQIQLQSTDAFYDLIPDTQFWVELTIVKNGPLVTIQLPVINFQISSSNPDDFNIVGGYLVTVDGYLPADLRPSDIAYRSYVAPSGTGLSLPGSFTNYDLPLPVAGYILSLSNDGGITISGAGTFGNLIPPGFQIMLPTDITYVVEPHLRLAKNTTLSTGFTNIANFTNPGALDDDLRDTHVNDAFGGVAGWTWSDNSMVADQTNGTTNAVVAIGSVDSAGNLRVNPPVQLTDFGPEILAFDTAVAINRTNKNNIVVSYGVVDHSVSPALSYLARAVSFDGGKTWPENGPLNIQGTGNPSAFGDARGVGADKYGNIVYSATNRYDSDGNFIGQPFFANSIDGGITFELLYTVPAPADGFEYDYPQFCFGGDGLGNYGLLFVADIYNQNVGDINPVVGFIPITGLGQFGAPVFANLLSIINQNILVGITASADGRNWIFGLDDASGGNLEAFGMIFKSPGALDVNYAGPWLYIVADFYNAFESSQPGHSGFILDAIQSNIYDDQRQALYGLIANPFMPDNPQDMRLYFSISRDNGQTWSSEIDIANTNLGNRGYQSMALDTVTGDLYFGFYDGRNGGPEFQSLEYMAAVIPAAQLDELVNKIPLTDPLYSVPSSATPPPMQVVSPAQARMLEKRKERTKKRFERKKRNSKSNR